jgi:hypothetical protein
MNDTKNLLFTDSGKGHYLIKHQWVLVIIFLFGCGITFYILILAIPLAGLAWTTGKAIDKNEINNYDNGIEGYGFKAGGFLPRLHNFELGYDDIKSVKKRRWGFVIRSTKGRFSLIVHNPEICVEKILLNAAMRNE